MMKFKFSQICFYLAVFLFSSVFNGFSTIIAQGENEPYPQLNLMKAYYSDWLATRDNSGLLVENDPNPIAIDIQQPRFTWIFDVQHRGFMQSAYHILVASDMKLLDEGKGDMWDSGLIPSSQSAQVKYSGRALESNIDYFWKVRIRDENGEMQPWSETASFSTALMDESDWKADWIGRGPADEMRADVETFAGRSSFPEMKDVDVELRSPLFRNEFNIDKDISRARLFIAGLGFYELHINGNKTGDQVLSPAKAIFRERVLYDTYDVTEELVEGNNAIGVMLGNGWYNFQPKYWGWRSPWYGSPRFVLQLEIEYADGTTSTVTSNDQWKASWGPITFNCIYDGEYYDARLEQEDWDIVGFDDSSWNNVNVVDSAGGKLESAMHAPNVKVATIKPLSVSEVRPDTFVVDMGQNFTGWIRVKFKDQEPGTEIKLKHAEKIYPNGRVDPSSANAAEQEDRYICSGDDVEVFEPRFTYHGFQYVEITGYTGELEVQDIEGSFVHADVNPLGSFACSNDLINLIHLSTVQSQRSNLQMGVPTDDTQRPERQGWGGDALMTAHEALLNMDMQQFYAKWFGDFRDQQSEDGLIGYIVPRPGRSDDLVWTSSYILMPWYQYVSYGDTAVLEENYSSMVRYMNYLARQGRSDVKPRNRGDNPLTDDIRSGDPHIPGYLQVSQWGDHLSISETFQTWTGTPLSISTAIYYHDLEVMKKIALVLGKEEHAEIFDQQSKKVKKAFNDRFLNTSGRYYDDGSQSAQAWPLIFGMVPPEYEEDVFNYLIKDIMVRHEGHPTTGYVGTKYMIDLLSEKGREDIVWNMALNTDFPGWGYMLRNGRTTITEKWTDGGSQNHIVLGAAIDPWFYNVLAGIQPDESEPGFKNFTIMPYVPDNDLDWVDATVHSLYGDIRSSWKKDGDNLIFEVTVPFNTSTTLILPLKSEKYKILESGKSVSRANGVEVVDYSESEAIFNLQPGNYQFTIKGK